jgi:hypothetical protein
MWFTVAALRVGGLGISCRLLADELRREKLLVFNCVSCLVDIIRTIEVMEELAFWHLEYLEGNG